MNLDPRITIWVVFPILWVMICVGMIKFYVLAMMQEEPLEQNAKQHTENSYIKFTESVIANGGVLGSTAYTNTASKLSQDLQSGSILSRPEFSGLVGLFNPLALDRAVAQFRVQAFTYFPQTIVLKWIGLYFSGIVVLKLPFPLTPRFKELLHSGLSTGDIDVRWVSSASLYVLIFLGIGSVLDLILPAAPPAPKQPVTMDLLRTLGDQLGRKHTDDLKGVEDRVIKSK